MVEAESMEESVEDMTAAETAPNPKKATAFGVRYCRAKGSTTCTAQLSLDIHFIQFGLVDLGGGVVCADWVSKISLVALISGGSAEVTCRGPVRVLRDCSKQDRRA